MLSLAFYASCNYPSDNGFLSSARSIRFKEWFNYADRLYLSVKLLGYASLEMENGSGRPSQISVGQLGQPSSRLQVANATEQLWGISRRSDQARFRISKSNCIGLTQRKHQPSVNTCVKHRLHLGRLNQKAGPFYPTNS